MENSVHYHAIASAIRFIEEHQQEQPSLDVIAQHVHLSKFHFQRLFKEWAGVSPKEFLQYLTIEYAKEALRRGKSTLDAAFDAGLTGNGRLHDLFLKLEACSPGEFKKRGIGMDIQLGTIATPFGKALIAETQKGIHKMIFFEEKETAIEVFKKDLPKANFVDGLGLNGILVQEYFKDWKVPSKRIQLDLKGTPFQIQVWKALLQIPSNGLLTYQQIAQEINNPKAVRAVGTAIGRNPIAYLIPCHRVIRGNGSMGGYRWNVERKKAILGYEAIQLNT